MRGKINLFIIAVLISFGLCASMVQGQTHSVIKDTPPRWIAMMKDTNTNYFEAVKCFNAYWKDHETPPSEDERFERASKDGGARGRNIPYSFEYRKFLRWKMEMKPYVLEDGKIQYPYQRHRLRHHARGANANNIVK